MQCPCAILSSVACPALLYFSTLSHKGHNVRKKKSWTSKCLFWFQLKYLSVTSHSKKNWVRCDQKYILVFMQSTRYSYPILIKFEFYRQYSNIKFHINPSTGSPVVPYGRQMDMTNSRFSQFCECIWTLRIASEYVCVCVCVRAKYMDTEKQKDVHLQKKGVCAISFSTLITIYDVWTFKNLPSVHVSSTKQDNVITYYCSSRSAKPFSLSRPRYSLSVTELSQCAARNQDAVNGKLFWFIADWGAVVETLI